MKALFALALLSAAFAANSAYASECDTNVVAEVESPSCAAEVKKDEAASSGYESEESSRYVASEQQGEE